MKRFIPGIRCQDALTKPEDDYSNAKKFQYIFVGDHYLFYRRLPIIIRYIPIKDITRCYIRVDSCASSCCCARIPFDSKSLVVVTLDGKEKKLWLDNRSVLDSIIKELTAKNNDIAASYCAEAAHRRVNHRNETAPSISP